MFFLSVLIFGFQLIQTRAQMVINIVNVNEVMNAVSIDDLLFTVQYNTTFIPDTLNPDKVIEETMMLKVGKKNSAYYSYAKYLTDSIVEVDKANGAGRDIIAQHMQQYTPKVTYQIFKNHPTNRVTTLDRLAMSSFRCEEENQIPEWNLLPDTMTILSYPCQKATCHFKGRDYVAWFTSEIPRSEGPWKLYGLPGLILKANDTQNHYTFVCAGLIRSQGNESILFPGSEYQPVSRKEMNKMFERYYNDPVGFIASSAPNVKITITDEDGQATKSPKNIPFNPIECQEK